MTRRGVARARRLTRAFYERDALAVARDLIGTLFFHRTTAGTAGVRLVEVEAYRGPQDPGSHGYRGPTPRNSVMFGPPGRLYVYFTYGMHWCANIVCGGEGRCEAVLLRAGEPVTGIDLMRARRPRATKDTLLGSGPARLAEALAIGPEQKGESLLRGGVLWCAEDEVTRDVRQRAIQTTRIGLAQGKGDDIPWRWVVAGHPHASRRDPLARG